MQNFFPTRTRKELKMKYKREESSNPELVGRVMDNSTPLGKHYQKFILSCYFDVNLKLLISVDVTPFEIQLGIKIEIPATTASADQQSSSQDQSANS